MFQFPGFALKTLCIQVKSTWFTILLITPKRNNNTVLGGLPHSEIHGSKHILSSPWLIAEYHVLHRLLLPRHPPNALLALDLIQKKQDWLDALPLRYLSAFWALLQLTTHANARRVFQIKSILSRLVDPCRSTRHLVSVLDLDNSVRFSLQTCGRPRKQPIHMLAAPEGLAQD
jgi:hypothetical protein